VVPNSIVRQSSTLGSLDSIYRKASNTRVTSLQRISHLTLVHHRRSSSSIRLSTDKLHLHLKQPSLRQFNNYRRKVTRTLRDTRTISSNLWSNNSHHHQVSHRLGTLKTHSKDHHHNKRDIRHRRNSLIQNYSTLKRADCLPSDSNRII